MFDGLVGALDRIFTRLRGYGKLNEANISDALREIRTALLEADVNYRVAKDFIDAVRVKCLGKTVLDSITPGQQVVKEVHDELVKLLGGVPAQMDMTGNPATVLLLGLHGSGKTTTAAKLASAWKRAGKKVLLTCCDTRRPAAAEQLSILASRSGIEVVLPLAGESVQSVGCRGLKTGEQNGADIVLFDTGGRFQIDEDLVNEVRDLRIAVKARNVLLVADSALGQESVNVAGQFHSRVGITGVILTKLDGDSRGGAALSIRAVTGAPVLFSCAGEHIEDIEPFSPDRMSSRILGMGDVVGLVEKAQRTLDAGEIERLDRRLSAKDFNLEDFLVQLRQMKRMGPVENLLEMLPGAGKVRASMGGPLAAADYATFAKRPRRSF